MHQKYHQAKSTKVYSKFAAQSVPSLFYFFMEEFSLQNNRLHLELFPEKQPESQSKGGQIWMYFL